MLRFEYVESCIVASGSERWRRFYAGRRWHPAVLATYCRFSQNGHSRRGSGMLPRQVDCHESQQQEQIYQTENCNIFGFGYVVVTIIRVVHDLTFREK